MTQECDRVIVPVSGGKDSQMVLSLALKKYPAEMIEAVHQFTGYDHSLTYQHLKWMEDFYGVEIKHSKSDKYSDLFDMIRKIQYFPNTVARACTGRLKITPFAQWLVATEAHKVKTLVLLGMRGAESAARSSKYGENEEDEIFSICDVSTMYPKKLESVRTQLPIVRRTTSEVFEYLRREGAQVNKLYRRGHSRVGCYPCLLAGDVEWRLASRDPEGRVHIQQLLNIESEFNDKRNNNHRKLIRIHSTRDIQKMMKEGTPGAAKSNPFGFEANDAEVPCAWCNY